MVVAILKKVRQKIRDVGTISALCKEAEQQARSIGELKPGVEHFVLAAFTLEDGEAKNLLNSFNIGLPEFQDALQSQHREALKEFGIRAEDLELHSVGLSVEAPKIFQAQPSSQEFMKKLYELNRNRSAPLSSLHVLEASVQPEYGVVKRAFDVLGVSLEVMREAILKRQSQVESTPGI